MNFLQIGHKGRFSLPSGYSLYSNLLVNPLFFDSSFDILLDTSLPILAFGTHLHNVTASERDYLSDYWFLIYEYKGSACR